MSTDVFKQLLGVVVMPVTNARLRLRGADAPGFLHRMSTQHVEALEPGQSRLNVLPNKSGRVVDLVHQLALARDEVVLISAGDDAGALTQWLDEYMFVEEIEIEDESTRGALVVVAGAAAPDAVDAVVPGAAACAPWQMCSDGGWLAVRSFDLASVDGPVPSWLVWDTAGDVASVCGRFEGAVRADLEPARVEAGVPAAPGEVSDAFNPLELALHDAIHWAKGCYIGQEVISRIDNYGKQSRHLVGLVVDGEVSVGDKVTLEDKEIGSVTSVSPAPRPGKIGALAVIKHKGGDPVGLSVQVGERPARTEARLAAQTPHD